MNKIQDLLCDSDLENLGGKPEASAAVEAVKKLAQQASSFSVAEIDELRGEIVKKCMHTLRLSREEALRVVVEGFGKPSTATAKILALVVDADLWLDQHRAVYVSIETEDGRRDFSVDSSELDYHLTQSHRAVFGTIPSQRALQEALRLLDGEARFRRDQRETHLRYARTADSTFPNTIWVDLGDPDGRGVMIDRGGWQVVSDTPVVFRRPASLLPLPVPEKGGSIDDLRPFVNVPEDDFPLLVAVLVSMLRAGASNWIVGIEGPQGSGKSTLTDVIAGLVHPHRGTRQHNAAGPEDLLVSSLNSALVAFDNLDRISPSLSDTLCRLSTGGGLRKRRRYKDHEENVIEVVRPIVINGITTLLERPDALDRAVVFHLPEMISDSRVGDTAFKAEFEAKRSRILGVLYDCVSAALRDPEVEVKTKPRMLDPLLFGMAGVRALGWDPAVVEQRYWANRDDVVVAELDDEPIGRFLWELTDTRGRWEGTAHDLLRLANHWVIPQLRGGTDWPSSPRGMTAAVKRYAPSLHAVGIKVHRFRTPDSDRRRMIVLERVEDGPRRMVNVSTKQSPGSGEVGGWRRFLRLR
jgi:energy-coupling factor transporter ATP-binding protein EcfA2